MKLQHLIIPALLLVGCEAAPSAPRAARAQVQQKLGAMRPLKPLPVRAPLPASAKVEDLSEDGMPRHVGVTSMDPELILDVEEVDDLSPTYGEVVKLGMATVVPGDRTRLERSEQRADGSFAVVVEHTTTTPELGELKSYTVDMRVPVGRSAFDCTGTASTLEVAERIRQTCESLSI